jgi:hypothetical protein
MRLEPHTSDDFLNDRFQRFLGIDNICFGCTRLLQRFELAPQERFRHEVASSSALAQPLTNKRIAALQVYELYLFGLSHAGAKGLPVTAFQSGASEHNVMPFFDPLPNGSIQRFILPEFVTAATRSSRRFNSSSRA